MRDDRAKWRAPAELEDVVTVGALRLERKLLARQTCVSGVHVRDTAQGTLIGWPDTAGHQSYTVSLRRDQVLIVNGPAMQDGWDADNGQAVSDMTDGFAVFDLSGPYALAVLQRGAEIVETIRSASAMRRLFGLTVIVYRIADPTGFRLHIERARADALQDALTQAMAFADRQFGDGAGT